MLSRADNELITRVGPGTPMGEALRQYWLPAVASDEIERDGAPLRVRMLGEELLAFRNSSGEAGLVDSFCPHRRAPLFFGRNEDDGLRCVYHGWKFDVQRSLHRHAERTSGFALQGKGARPRLPVPRTQRRGMGVYGFARRSPRFARPRMESGRRRTASHHQARPVQQLRAGARGRDRPAPRRFLARDARSRPRQYLHARSATRATSCSKRRMACASVPAAVSARAASTGTSRTS